MYGLLFSESINSSFEPGTNCVTKSFNSTVVKNSYSSSTVSSALTKPAASRLPSLSEARDISKSGSPNCKRSSSITAFCVYVEGLLGEPRTLRNLDSNGSSRLAGTSLGVVPII